MRKRVVTRALPLIGTFLASVPEPGVSQLQVPHSSAEPAVLDGSIDVSEWAAALVVEQGDVQLLFQERGGFLEIALRTPPIYVASFCVDGGGVVHILHSSSAVGQATYRRSGDGWELAQDFEWRLRSVDGVPASPEAQEAHLLQHGWSASAAAAGAPGETEFRISSSFFPDGDVVLALGLLLEADQGVWAWPLEPGVDGCGERATIAGPLPDRLEFQPAAWTKLTVPSR